jgi:hypothetical protein
MAVRETGATKEAVSQDETIFLAAVSAVDDLGQVWIHLGAPSSRPVLARTLRPVTAKDRGRTAAVVLLQGDPEQPLVLGLVHEPETALGPLAPAEAAAPRAIVDGDRLVLEAAREIVLKCGQASLTLTRAGKVLIRGAYVLSRSSGVNRIKGGSVQIN